MIQPGVDKVETNFSFTKKRITLARWYQTDTLIAVCDESAVYFFDEKLNLMPLKHEFYQIEMSVNIINHLR